ncbi:hypothetical protein QZH41_007478 [Actinostola sp. cb2023]|nr:hypothetical protein QZH41_007478 [Actinostola sp. cb2023]
MASRFPEPEPISRELYSSIFGDPDSDSDTELVSDLEFEGIEGLDSDNEQESDPESDEGEEELETLEWSQQLKTIVVEEFNSPTGKTFQLQHDAKEIDVFSILFNNEILLKIVAETNRYARQKLSENALRLSNWKDTTAVEIRAYLGVCIIMGLNSLPCIADYWSSDPFLGNEGIKQVMTKNRFEELSRFLHFNDSSVEPKRGADNFDCLYKVRPVLDYFNKKVQDIYNPSKNISVDEGMIAFKGRLSFRQYMPAKPTKYGIKVWIAADSKNGFVVNHKVYLGKEKDKRRENGIGYDVVTGMTSPFYNKYHHVYFDNFFSSPKLLDDLLKQNTYACSTVRPNRKGLPPCSKQKLKNTGETLCSQKSELLYTKWHDKRDVNVLATNVDPLDPPVVTERRKKTGEVNRVEKPKAIVMYNAYMGGVDHADQLRSYYSICRSCHKWYKYLFWFIFEVVLGNGFILYKEHLQARGRRYTLRDFRLAIGKQLIGGFSSRSENRKRSLKAAAVDSLVSPENTPGHFIGKRAGRKRHCVQCKKDGRTTTSDRAKETVYECIQCNVALCKEPCFLQFHT